jgi:predicted AAA+ superfamily ATPase
LKKISASKKAVIIVGARQVGKTTLLREIVTDKNNAVFLIGDEPDIRELLSNINSTQLSNIIGQSRAIIIDEAQLIPNIGITLKLFC